MHDSKTEYIVVDTSAFIKNAPLQNLANNLITTSSVVNEITSKRQIRRLVVLPYELKVQEPFPESINFVTEFSKKTGDYQSLSATDIQVIALTYQLHKEHVGDENLRKIPEGRPVINNETLSEEFKTVAGFYVPETEEESDDEGWITDSNLKEMREKIISEVEVDEQAKVACLTTDFAMQNVLKQIGLGVVSLDGKLIKEVRTFVLRCYGCFKVTSVMTHAFCPNCGNKTLRKVAVTTNADGTECLHINFKKPLTARGKKYSLPKPQGGKHGNNPILVSDQPRPEQRVKKSSMAKNNPLDEDYIAGWSPFLEHDVSSRSAMLGIRTNPNTGIKQWMRKNPNENVKRHGRKRK